MFKTGDAQRLKRQIDRFNVPMFIAQRYQDTGSFEVLALNARHESVTGLSTQAIRGKPITDLLNAKQAAAVSRKYEKCLTEKATQRYREVLDLPEGTMIWDTTLQYLPMPDGPDRIIGSAVVLERIERDDHDEIAFEDMRYLATTSVCELGKISALLEAVEQGIYAPDILSGSAGMLAGLCRTIDSRLDDIRSAAERRIAERATRAVTRSGLHLIKDAGDAPGAQDEVDTAIAALVGLIEQGTQHDRLRRQAG
ncbi:hypothetical protein BOO69_06110 [Sulfitobacter alexandrii]|uniref:PAS fold-4 domain-containing protein n=1 Tax=Sulfitobacter alexandrii TaxID=1917485 RepID=A0A1J0WFX7_9RHOB|nr:PAS domain-containing protein [Sulfitobacter alexandrii]APE43038.1 hypothetical protein BOO69_06110 [Sulfitobacter alexandrii]